MTNDEANEEEPGRPNARRSTRQGHDVSEVLAKLPPNFVAGSAFAGISPQTMAAIADTSGVTSMMNWLSRNENFLEAVGAHGYPQ